MPITPTQFSQATANASQLLVSRREGRYLAAFRDSLFEECGMIQIGTEAFHPANVLEKMAEETYRIARSESDQNTRDSHAETVTNSFPSPIALAYNSFLHGVKSPHARIGHMRDTWEAAVALCYGLVISEAAAAGIKLHEVLMRDGPNNNPRQLKLSDLGSDSIATRLGVVEGILIHWDVNNVQSLSQDIIPIDVIGEMRRLNDVRNGFSHSQTISELQAKKLIEESERDLLEVLLDLEGLASLDLFRVHEIESSQANTLQVERLGGYAMTRRLRREVVNPDVIQICASIAFTGALDPVLFSSNGRAFVASPYFYCGDDPSGHHTQVFMFKRKKNAMVKYEICSRAESKEFPETQIDPDMNRVFGTMTP